MTLVLTIEQDLAIREHAIEDYPGECCGALLGKIDGSEYHVFQVIPLDNRHEDGPARRFRIEADDLYKVEKTAREIKLTIVGFYHSHPDVPAVPSEYDRNHAWEAYSYLIVSATAARVTESRSWKLDIDSGRFNEENVLVKRLDEEMNECQ